MSPQETARAILDWYGGDASRWKQSGTIDTRNAQCLCVMNAAHQLVGLGRITIDDFRAFREAAKRALPANESFVAGWNDAPGRTFADVVELLERIAAEPTS